MSSVLLLSSIEYLKSDRALEDLADDVYWPKWTAPWWHMALLDEMGLSDQIPEGIVRQMTTRLRTQLVPFFFAEEIPPGRDPRFDVPCPCQLGNMYRVLSKAGVDVDAELPWARPWFLRYQMPDGGLNCDEGAYKSNPPASSLVGTIAPLEAILFCTQRNFTPEEEKFLDRGANCLLNRKLMVGCSVEYNSEERLDEPDWLKLCFPRFYLYDVLRGLNFVLRWSERREKPVPLVAIIKVIEMLEQKFPDEKVRIERYAYQSVGTRFKNSTGEWERKEEADLYPLLREVSRIGEVSPHLSSQWKAAKEKISDLKLKGLIQ